MPDHYSPIGFRPLHEGDAKEWLVRETLSHGDQMPVEGGLYVRWQAGNGAENWAQAFEEPDEGFQLTGCCPYFHGDASLRMTLVERIQGADCELLEGAYLACLEQSEGGMTNPLVFETPDFQVHADLSLPARVDVRLAAFAAEVSAYADEESYQESSAYLVGEARHGERVVRGVRSVGGFFPTGMFAADGLHEGYNANAELTGWVVATSSLTNNATGRTFQWARLRLSHGEIDLVATPDSVAGELCENGVVFAKCYFVGRIATDTRELPH